MMLVRYEAALAAMAAARTVDEVKDIGNKAAAMAAYARMAKDPQLEIDATEIRARATRRIGEMMAEQRETIGLNEGGRPKTGVSETPVSKPTLSEAGIDKNLAKQARCLASIPEQEFEHSLAAWRTHVSAVNERVTINPFKAADTTEAKKERRAARERELGQKQSKFPTGRFGLIYVDVSRHFNVRSDESGLGRAPENHFPTMTFDELVALPVADIAARDCICVYWSTAASLVDDIEIMAEWGFVTLRPRDPSGKLIRDPKGMSQRTADGGRYCSMQVWDKVKIGLGYWFRDRHEFIFVGVRGNPVPPAPGTQDVSIFAEPKTKHSAKPAHVAEMLERLWPNTPKIELFARGKGRPGWAVLGNEAEVGVAA